MSKVRIYNDQQELIGWFDEEKATCFAEATEWDGSNHVSIATGSRTEHEALYRTAGGRWVLYRWSQYQGVRVKYHFLSAGEARGWLLANAHDDAAEKYFGAIEEERGPGRPEIGPEVYTRLPEGMLRQLDKLAEEAGTSRAEVIRGLLEKALRDDEKTVYLVQMAKGTNNAFDETSKPRTLLETTSKQGALDFFKTLPERQELEEEERDLDGNIKYEAPIVVAVYEDGEEELIEY